MSMSSRSLARWLSYPWYPYNSQYFGGRPQMRSDCHLGGAESVGLFCLNGFIVMSPTRQLHTQVPPAVLLNAILGMWLVPDRIAFNTLQLSSWNILEQVFLLALLKVQGWIKPLITEVNLPSWPCNTLCPWQCGHWIKVTFAMSLGPHVNLTFHFQISSNLSLFRSGSLFYISRQGCI